MQYQQVNLPTELVSRISATAQNEQSIVAFVETAVQDRLDKLVTEKLAAEQVAFEQMHANLLEKHRGEYAAVHHGELIALAETFEALYRKVREQTDEQGILMQQITESPITVLYQRSFYIEQ